MNTTNTTQQVLTKTFLSPLFTMAERMAVWQRAKGMWRHKKPDPIVTLKRIRKEWDR